MLSLKLSSYKCRVYTAWLVIIIKYTREVNYSNLTIICVSSGCMMQQNFRDLHVSWFGDSDGSGTKHNLNGKKFMLNLKFFHERYVSIPHNFMQIQETHSIITVKISFNILCILLSYSSNKALAVFQTIFYWVRLKILL